MLPNPKLSNGADVVVVGAGPVGLMLANLLGRYGVSVTVVEERDELIDFPRGVGIDDETMRTFQTAGLADRILAHVIPNQMMTFVNAKGSVLAQISPSTDIFGWPRRNGFVQPLVDRVLLSGLDRYPEVNVLWGHRLQSLTQEGGVVRVQASHEGVSREIIGSYVVGADGGSSATRQAVGAEFPGQSAPQQWLVVDIRNDPLGRPGVFVGADWRRPYVSISIPHGIRRFEFMLLDDGEVRRAETPEFAAELLGRHLSTTADLDIIRRRVYTHHSRIADQFRFGRVFLAGDAAHLMPVWQGQGYNSGIRDASNLAWKLAGVVQGTLGDTVLDTYDSERRAHVRAMVQLSTLVGKAVSPRNRVVAALRDGALFAASAVPAVKRHLVEMRFKPMPAYEAGALARNHRVGNGEDPVGRLFIQPRVETRGAGNQLLDDVVGDGFALLAWNNSPVAVLDDDALALLTELGARLFAVRPVGQLGWAEADDDRYEVIGDPTGRLKQWFDQNDQSVLLLRPDRFVGGAARAHEASGMVRAVCRALALDEKANRRLPFVELGSTAVGSASDGSSAPQ